MSQNPIELEIQKSREAIDALAEHNRLEAEAARLPELMAEKRRQDAREQSERALSAAITEAAPKFASLAERAPKLRERIQAIITAVAPLAEEIRQIQNELYRAGKPVQDAAWEYDRHHAGKQASRDDPDNGLPMELITATLLDESLVKAGATNPALELTPDDFPEWARLLFRQNHAEMHYHPTDGSRNFRGRMF